MDGFSVWLARVLGTAIGAALKEAAPVLAQEIAKAFQDSAEIAPRSNDAVDDIFADLDGVQLHGKEVRSGESGNEVRDRGQEQNGDS